VHLLYIEKCSVDVNGDLSVWIPAGNSPFGAPKSGNFRLRRQGEGWGGMFPREHFGWGSGKYCPADSPTNTIIPFSFNFISRFFYKIKKSLKIYNIRMVLKIHGLVNLLWGWRDLMGILGDRNGENNPPVVGIRDGEQIEAWGGERGSIHHPRSSPLTSLIVIVTNSKLVIVMWHTAGNSCAKKLRGRKLSMLTRTLTD